MSENEILKEENGWRVTLIKDEHADEPYDDGQSPLLRIEDRYSGYHASAEHIQVGSMRPTGNDERIEEAAQRWASKPELFEKYLRAFHGATTIKWYGPNNYTDHTYVTYDTSEWVKAVGFDDKVAPRSKYDGAKAVSMAEYRAYLEGDVYGYQVERRVNVASIRIISAHGQHLRTIESEYDEWEVVDSCWGFYGYTYARESALEAYDIEKAA